MDPIEILDWLQGLADLGCTFVELIPNTKRTRNTWGEYDQMNGQRGLSCALNWLRKGSGLGILLKAPLWILDADSAKQVENIVSTVLDAAIAPLVVRTPSGGAHFYFRFPEAFPLEGMKNHVCHPFDDDGIKLAMDFKLGFRTLLVAPGTMRNGKPYLPASPWRLPPVVDPRMFLPHGKFWRDHRPFSICTRPLRDRIARACKYLQTKAPIAISGKGGHKTLAGVTAHLVSYLDLDPELAFNLLTHGDSPWNERCVDMEGTPFPWDKSELWNACVLAVDAVPQAGVKHWEREQATSKERSRLTSMVLIVKECASNPGMPPVPVRKVLDAFEWLGLPDLADLGLGRELVAQGVPRKLATRKRTVHIPGLDYWAMLGRILEADRLRQVNEGRTAECPLMKHLRSLRGVESNVSTNVVLESPANAAFFTEISNSASYQMAFPWAGEPAGFVLAPTSPYLAKLRVLVSAGLLGVMAPRPPAELRDKVCRMFWPNHRVPMTDLRMMRLGCRNAGLVADDGSLTKAGLLALGLEGAA